MGRKLRSDPIDLAHRNWTERRWDDAAGGMAIVTSVMRVQQIFAGEVEAVLKPIGLTFARYEVLMLLDFSRSGQLPLGKIGERLQVHPASVTNAVDRLESDGVFGAVALTAAEQRIAFGLLGKIRHAADDFA